MKHKFALALLGVLGLLLSPNSLLAQEPEPTEGEESDTEQVAEEYTVKAYSLTIWGGWFSGTTFLDLQPLEDRTQLEEGSDVVYKYDGSVFTPQELIFSTWSYQGARKEIEPGFVVGGKIGIYLSDQFHIDVVGAYGSSQAKTTYINSDPENLDSPFREELDRDNNITIFMGGGDLVYDATTVKFLGFSPFVGFGIGGIINRFTQLEDKTALYFQLVGGLNFSLTQSLLLHTEFNATTFSFSREELHYGKQVTYTSIRLGLTWMFNLVPEIE